MSIVKSLDKIIESFTTKALVLCVLSMLFFSVLNIVLRWFNAHVMWIEPFVRYMVVLSAFLGGVIATGRRTHIGIDIVGKYFETKKMITAHSWVKRIVDVVSIVALIFLTKGCVSFVFQEAQYGRAVFLGIHAKYLAMILPFGFGLMGVRFLLGFILSFESNQKEQA